MNALPYIAFLALPLFLLGPSVWGPEALAAGDWNDLIYPFYRFVRDSLAADGRLPFWNPLILCGQPHLVSMNCTALYPTEVPAMLAGLGPERFYALDLVLHLWLSASLFFLWMRRKGVSRGGAFIGGLSYMLGGHLLTLAGAGHPHWVRGMAVLPLFFAALESGRWGLAGAALALPALGLQFQFMALAGVVGLGWIVLLGPGGAGNRAWGVLAMAGTAAALTAVLLVPGWEYYRLSVRAAPSPGLASEWAMSPWEFPGVLLPDLYGTGDGYFGPHLFRLTTDYPGVVPLALAAAGLASGWREGRRWACLAAVSVVLALGPNTVLGEVLARVPVFSGLRTPLRWMTFVHLAACVLAARGWDAVTGGRRVARGMAVACASLAAALGATALWPGPAAHAIGKAGFVERRIAAGETGPETVRETLRNATTVRAVFAAASAAGFAALAAPLPIAFRAGPLVAVAVADLLFASAPYFTFSAPDSGADPVVSAILAAERGRGSPYRAATVEYFGLADRRMGMGVEWAGGYHGLPLAGTKAVLDLASSNGSEGLLSVLNVRYVVAPGPMPPGWIRAGRAGDLGIFRNPGFLPRVFPAARVVPVRGMGDALAVLRAPGWTPTTVPVEMREGEPALAVGAKGRIAYAGGRDRVVAGLEMQKGGLVVVSDAWYPAWKALLDGRRVRIYRTFGSLRGVEVPAGSHILEMNYDSVSFKIGLWLSLCSFGFAFMRVAWSLSRARVGVRPGGAL